MKHVRRTTVGSKSSQRSLASEEEGSGADTMTISTESSSALALPLLTAKHQELLEDERPPYDIDFIGTGSFQVSQLNLLQIRSLEPLKSSDAALSARGKSHRSREQFLREAQNTTTIIMNEARRAKRLGQEKPSPKLLVPYFQRALAFERLKMVDRAIADYGVCINIDSSYAPAYFNRAGLYHMQDQSDLALVDLDMAIKLDPANTQYRSNRALILRSKGSYLEAIGETMVCKAVEMNPELKKELQLGNALHFDGDSIGTNRVEEDPVVLAMQVPKEDRTQMQLEAITDFLKTVKFFHPFRQQMDVLCRIASSLEMREYSKGDIVFDEGQFGEHFFMVLDGEVTIVKTHLQVGDEVKELVALVKLFRSHSFGETALEHKGIRTAGAIATGTLTRLLLLHGSDYEEVTHEFKTVLRAEACRVLTNCPVFADWDPVKIEELADYAEIQMFSANTEILKAGDQVKFLYIVKKGIVKLNKSIDKPSMHRIDKLPKLKSAVGVGMEVPGLWVMEKNWRDRLETFDHTKGEQQVDFTVGVLGSGQVFGELSVLDPEISSPVSAVSFTPVELYVFESEKLKELDARFNATTMNALNESMNLHNPPGEKIAYYFRSKYMWERRKFNLLQQVDAKRNNSGPHSTNAKYDTTGKEKRRNLPDFLKEEDV